MKGGETSICDYTLTKPGFLVLIATTHSEGSSTIQSVVPQLQFHYEDNQTLGLTWVPCLDWTSLHITLTLYSKQHNSGTLNPE